MDATPRLVGGGMRSPKGNTPPKEVYESVGLDTENGSDPLTSITNITDNLPKPKTFPVEALPKACRELAHQAAAAIGCPPEFVGLPMLVTLGAAIGNARTLKLKEGWIESAAIYGAVVAPPGAKKTPAEKVAAEPAIKKQAALREIYRKEIDEYKRELRVYEVDKKAAAKDGEPAPPPPESPAMERVLVEDTTVEALAVILGDTPRGVVVAKDELAGWVRSMDQYKAGGRGSDRQFWQSAWANRYVSVDRKGRNEPLILQRPFVGLYGGIQPDVLPELGLGRDDGMLDRFVFAYPERVPNRWSDDEISPEARATYAELYDGLRELHMYVDDCGDPEPKSVVLAADARPVVIDIINSHRAEIEKPGFSARLEGPWSKLEAYFGRLCLILALARSVEDGTKAEIVKRVDVLNALALVEYFKNHARRVYVGLYGENPDDRLAADVTAFLEWRGGAWEGQPAELHMQLESDYKPPRPNELSKRLIVIANRTPGLLCELGERWVSEVGNKRRFVKLTLKNVGNVGNAGKAES